MSYELARGWSGAIFESVVTDTGRENGVHRVKKTGSCHARSRTGPMCLHGGREPDGAPVEPSPYTLPPSLSVGDRGKARPGTACCATPSRYLMQAADGVVPGVAAIQDRSNDPWGVVSPVAAAAAAVIAAINATTADAAAAIGLCLCDAGRHGEKLALVG